jgi:hypothetical protein
MSFKTFLTETMLLEGGEAIKGSTSLSQAQAKSLADDVIKRLASQLNIEPHKLALIGSAGLKSGEAKSGDIDIAVEHTDLDDIKKASEALAFKGKFKHMPGIKVYSFAAEVPEGYAQVDIMPVPSLEFAQWSYFNDPADLKAGLKGSHRNELLFAVAKHVDTAVTEQDDDGSSIAQTRLALDLSNGLFKLTQTRAGKKKKAVKSFTTTQRDLITCNPNEVARALFGAQVKAADLMSYGDVLKQVASDSFINAPKRDEIIATAIKGLERKGLKVPSNLSALA